MKKMLDSADVGMLTKQKKLILWIMKKSLFFFIALFSVTSFGYTQNFSLNLGKVTLHESFDRIKKAGKVTMFYSDDELNVDKLVRVKFTNKTALEMVSDLVGPNFEVKLVDNSVLLIAPISKEAALTIKELADITVTGKVTNELGENVVGATVTLKGTKKAVLTDADGNFSINIADGGGVLVVSNVGYTTQEVKASKAGNLKIVLVQETAKLDDVVIQVAFGNQKKKSIVSSITTVKPSELRVASSNLTTALAGKVSGLIGYQRGGEPGRDNAEFFVRGVTTFGYGSSPLILIDGVELNVSDLRSLRPDDIASFSIMKDATATALYGARGANGVIYVTTKEGKEGPVKVSGRMETSMSRPTSNVRLADPITYMRLGNEAVKTRDPLGLLPYSPEKIDNTIAGTNPMLYPTTDWQKELFKDYTLNKRINFSLNGGGKTARYYLSIAASQDNGILKVPSVSNFNNNVDFRQYNIRSNTNINLTETSKLKLSFTANFQDFSGPVAGGSDIYKMVMRTNPVLFRPFYEKDAANEFTNHMLFGNYGEGNYLNPYAQMVRGYEEGSNTKVIAQVEFNQNMRFLTEGLDFKMIFNGTKESEYSVYRSYNPYYYRPFQNPETGVVSLKPLNEKTGTEYLDYNEGTKYIASSTYVESNLTYNKSIDDKNDISGLLVFTLNNRLFSNAGNLQKSLPYRNMGLSGRFTYANSQKYFAEFNFGYNGSERFSQNNRWGFFPAVGLGWLASNEKFFEKYNKVVTKLKFKATYGLVGNDKIGSADDRFFYLSQVNMNDETSGYTTGENFQNYLSGIAIQRYANDLITWETAKKMNVGVELSLFDKLDLNVDAFREDRSNILSDRILPSSMGLQAGVKANVGEVRAQGIDGSLTFKQDFKNGAWLQVMGNFTYATNKITKKEEPDYSATPWLSAIGQPINQVWGYVAERLFVDQAEVNNSPLQTFGEYSGGDIKYKDINGDGKISGLDKVPIGNPTVPEIVYGAGFSAGYKGFDLSCFFQGAANSSFWIDTYATAPFVSTEVRDSNNNLILDPTGRPFVGGNQLLKAYADDHWSEANRNVYALWPRLSNNLNENNTQTNTWFMQDGAFLRMKTLEIGYSLSDELTAKLKMEKVRFYTSGTNLFVLSKFKLWDPELAGNGLGYPNQRVFNVGVNVSF